MDYVQTAVLARLLRLSEEPKWSQDKPNEFIGQRVTEKLLKQHLSIWDKIKAADADIAIERLTADRYLEKSTNLAGKKMVFLRSRPSASARLAALDADMLKRYKAHQASVKAWEELVKQKLIEREVLVNAGGERFSNGPTVYLQSNLRDTAVVGYKHYL